MIFTHNISPILLEFGPIELRWYGLMYAIGLGLFYLVTTWIFKREKLSVKHLDSLVIWLFFGLLIGARLGHVFFYEATYYLANPWQILAIWNGGLASHGGALGIFLGYFGWCRFNKVKFGEYVNAIVVGMPLAAGFVRVGNFFNSEIVGYPTGSDFGVIFARLGEDFARHPVQLYSALFNFVLFGVLLAIYKKWYRKMPKVSLMVVYVFLEFSGRFVLEFWKDLQGPVPEDWGMTTGQFLSVWPVAICLIYFAWLLFAPKFQKK